MRARFHVAPPLARAATVGTEFRRGNLDRAHVRELQRALLREAQEPYLLH
jgi:hypothetical protein